MKVLVACEYTAVVRDAFRSLGHDAYSCDLLRTEGDPQWHYRRDALEVLTQECWDLVVAFPPCTDLANIGAASWAKKQADGRQAAAAAFFRAFLESDVGRVAVENPTGWMNSNYRKPDQKFHPYHFGHPWMKQTCLWLKGLPPLQPTDVVEPTGRWVAAQRGYRSKAETSALGIEYGARRWKNRSRTFPGVAAAMAAQWGAWK